MIVTSYIINTSIVHNINKIEFDALEIYGSTVIKADVVQADHCTIYAAICQFCSTHTMPTFVSQL